MILLDPDSYRLLVRPLFFRLPPEAAQRVAEFALSRKLIWRILSPALQVRSERLHVDMAGMVLRNPVGLAAGYDKNCEFLPSMLALGFGYVVGGTVTETPRTGNPRPRIIRYVEDQSLINALGFPNKGLDFVARKLEQTRHLTNQAPVIVSVSGLTASEIVRCHRRLEPLVSAVELNISSPNTAGLRAFQEPTALADLIGRLGDARKKPLYVKLPPYAVVEAESTSGGQTRDRVLGLVRVCVEQGVEGLTVSNTRSTKDSRLSVGMGGISGKLLFQDTLSMVADVKSEVGGRALINACGGISSGEDAWKALQAGASTVQLLTGLVYRGPGIVKRINEELLGIMDRQGVDTIVN